MSLARRLQVGLALGACALSVVLLGPWRARAATAVPSCAPSHLHLKFVDFQGATGRRYWDFAYKNTGPKCSIKGYPKIVLLNGHGHALSDKVHHLTGSHATKVTIAHNGRAFFTFQYADSGFCSTPPVVAHKFKIFAPGATSATLFNPAPQNMGPASICKGSEMVWPLRGKLAPFARDATAAASPICSPGSLRLDAVGGQGFTSHTEIVFALRNVSAHTCHLHGYPGVAALDANAGVLNPTASRKAGSKPTITLHTWQRAFFDVVYTDGGPCIPHTVTAYGLQVIPPGDTGHLVYYLGKTSLCAPPTLTVTPVSHNSTP